MRDQPAGVEFGEDSGQAEPFLESRKTVGDHFRSADDSPTAPRLVPSNRLQPMGALDAPRGVENPGAVRRLFEPRAEIAVELHQALLGVGERLVDRVADIDRGAQIDFTVAGVTRAFSG